MLDALDFDIRCACAGNIAQTRRDGATTRFLYIAPAMAKILVAEHVDLDRRTACREALAPFFAGEDIHRLLDAAIVVARDIVAVEKGTVQ